jgi:hypothetical protein
LAEAAAQPPQLGLALLYLLNGFLPLIVTVGLMSWLIWPRLVRVRELYADAGVMGVQEDDQSMWAALSYYGARIRLAAHDRRRLLPWPAFDLIGGSIKRLFNRWLRFHPTLAQRRANLDNPASAFGRPFANGMLAGVLSVLLDVLLVGAFSAFYAAQIPGAVPAIVGTVAVSVTLLPYAVHEQTGFSALRSVAWIVGLVIVWRMGWHFLNLILLWFGALFAPGLTSEILSGFVHNMAGALVTMPEGIVPPEELLSLAIKSTVFWLYLGVLLTFTLSGAVALEWWLRRLALTWYFLRGGTQNLKWVLIGITLWTLTLVAGLWLPLVALITPVSPTPIYPLVGWLVLGFNALLVMGGAALFALGYWLYAHRCPKCKQRVPGWFWLGRQCPMCQTLLWPEMILPTGR